MCFERGLVVFQDQGNPFEELSSYIDGYELNLRLLAWNNPNSEMCPSLLLISVSEASRTHLVCEFVILQTEHSSFLDESVTQS